MNKLLLITITYMNLINNVDRKKSEQNNICYMVSFINIKFKNRQS